MSRYGKLLLSVAMLILTLSLLTGFAYAESKTAVVNGDDVNLRAKPSTSASIVTKVDKGTEVSILSEDDGWYNVSVKNKKGWISTQFVSVKSEAAGKGKILAEDVNLRSNPNLSAKVIKKLDKGESVSLIEGSGEWVKIKTSANETGWVKQEFVSGKPVSVSRGAIERTPKKETVETPKIEAPKEEAPKTEDDNKTDDSGKAQELVEYAKKYLGVKYVYGGSSPKGFDCSGFTSYVFDHFGIDLERVAASQAGQGKKISKSELKAGDLVFFDTNGGRNYICHVGIYIGDGKFIHASSGRNSKRVVISDLSEGFYENAYMTARRVLK
ncbi:MAG: SH3 domain-containing protein [Clostridia bacterium]|nr:SH3 domain-containing protein [Clostridia bacterium]